MLTAMHGPVLTHSLTNPPTYLSNAHILTKSLNIYEAFSWHIERCAVDLTCAT